MWRRRFRFAGPQATGILQFLEKEGYIYREAVERDARLKRIVPTEKTVELHGHIIANIHYMEDILKEGIPRGGYGDLYACAGTDVCNLAGNEKDRGRRQRNMNRKLLRSVREYKRETILTPVFVALEVFMEVLIPLLMAKIIDVGIMNGDIGYIIRIGIALVALAMVSLFFGAKAGQLGAIAAAGYAKNLRP